MGGDGVVAVDKERCLQGQAGDGEVWVIALKYCTNRILVKANIDIMLVLG